MPQKEIKPDPTQGDPCELCRAPLHLNERHLTSETCLRSIVERLAAAKCPGFFTPEETAPAPETKK